MHELLRGCIHKGSKGGSVTAWIATVLGWRNSQLKRCSRLRMVVTSRGRSYTYLGRRLQLSLTNMGTLDGEAPIT